MRKLLTLVFVTISFQVLFAQKQKLGFNLVVGQTYYLTIKSATTDALQNVNGPKVKINFNSSSRIAFKVIDCKDSIYNLSASFQQLSGVTNLPIGPFGDINSFDSDNKNISDTFSNVAKEIIDKPFLVRMTAIGKIVDIKNMDAVFKQALARFPLTMEQKLTFKGELNRAFGEDVFKDDLEMATAIYPDKPVQKGGHWTIQRNPESRYSDTLISTYEWKDKAESYNVITGTGNNKTVQQDGYRQTDSMQVRADMADSIHSNLKVDNKTGWITEGTINEVMAGSSDIKNNPKFPGGLQQTASFLKEITYSSK